MPGQFEIVAGAHQCGKMAPLIRRIGDRFAIWPEPSAPRKGLCRQKSFGLVRCQRIDNLARDAHSTERLGETAMPISPPRQRTHACLGELGVVDISGSHELCGNCIDRRRIFPIPTPRRNLALEIRPEVRLGRCEAADIVQRERFEGGLIQRPYRARRSGLRQSAVFVPQSNRIENDTFQYPQTKVATGAIICRTSPT